MKLFQPALYEIGKATHAGKARAGSPNQDSLKVILPPILRRFPALLVLADGMGGHAGGALASRLVIEAFSRSYATLPRPLSPRPYLETTVRQAHRKVCQAAEKDPQLAGMGSTVVAAVLGENTLHLINVGDSRLYVFRGQAVKQISYDQSVVAELVRQGVLTPEEARHHPHKNQLTMSITARRQEVLPYCDEFPLAFEDVILLCSDGLWGVVPETLMRAAACQMRPQAAAGHLVQLANSLGGPDNISVIVARRVGSPLETIPEDTE
ncbi:MAG: protein phosphatase 2C domain-containing protein [Anaerolineaceae bacterium]|nr:protein phosphatase 2C domain-containing protein [Anaerolineaceae bacterium]